MPRSQWLALYQQEPIALDGNIIKTENFVKFNLKESLEVSHVIAVADTAFSTKNTADYSVIQIWGVVTHEECDSQGVVTKVPRIALLDMARGRYEYPDLIKVCEEMDAKHNPDVWVIEKKASGQSLIQDLRRRGFFITEFMPDKDKLTRVVACTPFIEGKRLMVPEVKWAEDFLDEAKAFPKGSHDDTVDCMSMAVLYLRDTFHIRYDQDYTDEDYEESHSSYQRRRYW
jgi:predicted phage terminase large subunit-like protein